MKTRNKFLMGAFGLSLIANVCFGQVMPQSEVPSPVVNSFQKSFSKTRDIEWKLDGSWYKVEFETGVLGTDHSVWYDKSGKIIRHKEDISKSDLPKKVLEKINADFSSYGIDDVEKVTEQEIVTYKLELKKSTEEWKVSFDSDGNILSKIAD